MIHIIRLLLLLLLPMRSLSTLDNNRLYLWTSQCISQFHIFVFRLLRRYYFQIYLRHHLHSFNLRKLEFILICWLRDCLTSGSSCRSKSKFECEPRYELIVFILVVHELDFHEVPHFIFSNLLHCLNKEVADNVCFQVFRKKQSNFSQILNLPLRVATQLIGIQPFH